MKVLGTTLYPRKGRKKRGEGRRRGGVGTELKVLGTTLYPRKGRRKRGGGRGGMGTEMNWGPLWTSVQHALPRRQLRVAPLF
jgi:hypothetical protein